MSEPSPHGAVCANSWRPAHLLRSFLALILTAGFLLVLPAGNVDATTGQTIWGTTKPSKVATKDHAAVLLGTRFTTRTGGQVTAIRYYKNTKNTGKHYGYLWDGAGELLTSVTFTSKKRSGWIEAKLPIPQTLVAGRTYVVGYNAPKGRYSYKRNVLGAGKIRTRGDITAVAGVYSYTGQFPRKSDRSTAYFVDVRFVKSPAVVAAEIPPTPTPTASPTTTPTASPTTTAAAGALNCVAKPSGCGYPDATNAGVSGGVALKRVPTDVTSGTGWTWDPRGWITAGDNAIVENLIIPASVDITGKNAIVRNNQITVTGETWAVALRRATNATVQNNEIGVPGATRLMVGIKDIYGDSHGTKVIGNDITNASTGIQIGEGLIEANYIHDLGMIAGDHINGTTSNGGTTQLTIRGNTILNKFDQTDAISLFQDFGVEANRLITGNLVAGGGYTIYGGDNQNFGKTYNIKITNNRFSTLYFPNGGSYGPYAAYDPTGAGNEFSGNIWDHTGLAVK